MRVHVRVAPVSHLFLFLNFIHPARFLLSERVSPYLPPLDRKVSRRHTWEPPGEKKTPHTASRRRPHVHVWAERFLLKGTSDRCC